MIVYEATKAEFMDDVFHDAIEKKVLERYRDVLRIGSNKSQISSWRNSMIFMERVIRDDSIPKDCGVAIEYQLPNSGKRIDFLLTGMGDEGREFCIIVELKQWSTADLSEKDGVVKTFVGGKVDEHTHPSYQAWSYACLMENFCETVTTSNVSLKPCAYLHNYLPDDVITHEHYQEYLKKAPVFLRGDAAKLSDFIKQFVKKGDKKGLLYRIEHGRIKPSKMLADSLSSMLKGNPEFVLIDDQKLVYETALQLAEKATPKKKQVLIVKGSPGTGKTVVAINLMVELTRKRHLAQYVSKNAAPRAVYSNKLAGSHKKIEISQMFTGSGQFTTVKPNVFKALIVDEAHRLVEKSGLYSNLGEHQVKELIQAAQCTIFFIDDHQRVTLQDIGSVRELHKWANRLEANVTEMELASQFRCNGSDGFLAWIDNTLQIQDTANVSMRDVDYDFRVFSDPNELRAAIEEKNKEANKARMVAGYCWEWNSKKYPDLYDVVIPEFDFKMQWNLTTDGSLWIISPESINQIGCIHTCQGLEVDYVGVIIGGDLLYQDGKLLTQPAARARSDKSISGYKKYIEKHGEAGKAAVKAIIKNTYRTLMTRGMKGCYVYCVDKGLEEYLRDSMK